MSNDNRHDSNRYDSNRYDSNRHDSNRYDNQEWSTGIQQKANEAREGLLGMHWGWWLGGAAAAGLLAISGANALLTATVRGDRALSQAEVAAVTSSCDTVAKAFTFGNGPNMVTGKIISVSTTDSAPRDGKVTCQVNLPTTNGQGTLEWQKKSAQCTYGNGVSGCKL